MKKLDIYILKKFFSTFFFIILLLTVIACVIDISEKTDDFVKSGLSAKEIFFQYFIGFIPHIAALLFPLFVFIAVIFFTSKMAGRSEIVAILASGTSFRRLMRPYWVGGALLALLLWYANQYVIPRANAIRTRFEAIYVNGNSSYNPLIQKSSNIYRRIDSFTYAGMHYYDTVNKMGGPFFMDRIKHNKVVYNLRAETLKWDTTVKKWMVTNVVERELNNTDERVWMSDQKVLDFNFKPYDLSRDEYAKDKLTTAELDRFIQLEEMRGSEGLNTLKVERHRRYATPLSILILTIMGVSIAARKVRGGSGVHLALGFCLAAAYIILDKFSTVFSTKGSFPPVLAAWMPNIIFAFVAYFIYRKAPK